MVNRNPALALTAFGHPPLQDKALDKSIPCFTHAPFTLFPSPFPREAFEEAKRVQQDFNLLVHKVSLDHEYLSQITQE